MAIESILRHFYCCTSDKLLLIHMHFVNSVCHSNCLSLCKSVGKKRNANGAVVYRNKIYENFSISNATINPTSLPRSDQPGIETNIRSTTRSTPYIVRQTPHTVSQTPHTVSQTQREECIYEN